MLAKVLLSKAPNLSHRDRFIIVSLGAAVTAAGLKIIKLANSFAVQNFARDFEH